MLEILQIINITIVIIAGAFALLVTFSKPLRKKFFENKKAKESTLEEIRDELKEIKCELQERREADKSLLRDRIVTIYFKNKSNCEIRQYEFENVSKLYNQYIKLGGNSFVCKIYAEMQDWQIIS